jgi:hypothetical protein
MAASNTTTPAGAAAGEQNAAGLPGPSEAKNKETEGKVPVTSRQKATLEKQDEKAKDLVPDVEQNVKEYVLVRGTHMYRDDNGNQVQARPGDAVMLDSEQAAAFADKFLLREEFDKVEAPQVFGRSRVEREILSTNGTTTNAIQSAEIAAARGDDLAEAAVAGVPTDEEGKRAVSPVGGQSDVVASSRGG